MKFINNISIKMRLLLMVIPPLLIIIFYSILSIKALLTEKENLEMSKSRTQEVESLAKAIHFMQIERGLSVGFSASDGAKNKDKLPEIRQKVDSAIGEIKEVYAKTKGDSSVLNNLSELNQKRSAIDSLSVSAPDVGAYFSKTIISIIDSATTMPSVMDDKEGRNIIQAYTHLATAKEQLGQLRANLNGAFTKDSFAGNTYFAFGGSIGAYQVNSRKFKTLAPTELSKFYENTFKGEVVDKTFAMIDTALAKGNAGGFGIDASVWFTNVTASIDLLRNVELELYRYVYKVMDEKIENLSMKFNMTLAFVIFFILAGIAVSIFLTKNIVNPINAIQQGLQTFFLFLNRQTTKADLIKLDSKDEFGEMAKVINENISSIEKGLIADKQMIDNTQAVMNRVRNGWYSEFIEVVPNSNELDVLKQTLNDMIKANHARFLEIDEILEAYAKHNYTPSAHLNPADEKGGILDRLVVGLNAMQTSITEMLSTSLQNGIDLQSDASNLKQAVESLSTASNEQAASLEETAAAMEEMTSNVQNNASKSNDMAIMAKETDKAAKEGAALAQRTASAMTEIQSATNSINDAVAIIENIAFQTNILSLNAAVEAATAGDAGKGFAVVAQEVRNLANRSADAAKEIKAMAVRAAEKSNEGMNISTELTKGFEVIASKIEQTTMLVQDVSNASKEQMQGIGQINTAITQLDQMTQENAKVAAQADSIANATIDKAEAMVEDAQSKEFVGKSNIRAKESSQRTNKHVEAAKPVVVSKNTHTQKQALPKKGSSHSGDDVWESF